MAAKVNYEQKQFVEQKETNFILWVNTAFAVIAGLATLALAVLALNK